MSSEFEQRDVAQATTSTTEEEIPRIVGDHPGNALVFGSAALVLALILLAGYVVTRRARGGAARR
jgi:hypothetical protein